MGSVFKKTATKPLPAGAKIIVRRGQQLAEWTATERDFAQAKELGYKP